MPTSVTLLVFVQFNILVLFALVSAFVISNSARSQYRMRPVRIPVKRGNIYKTLRRYEREGFRFIEVVESQFGTELVMVGSA